MSFIKNRKGMTLIEIMIVLAIIGGISAILLPRITGQRDKAKVGEAKIQMGQIVSALSMYYNDCGKNPSSLEGLVKPDANCSNWGPEPYRTEKGIRDPWGNPFEYESSGSDYSLRSLGRDGKEGGDGYNKDITLEDL